MQEFDWQHLLEESNKLIFVREYETAYQKLKPYVFDDDGQINMHAFYRYAELSFKLNCLDNLIEEIRTLQKKFVDKLELDVALNLVLQLKPGFDQTVVHENFHRLLQENSEDAYAYFGLAFSFERRGELEKSLMYYQRSIQADMEWHPSYFGISQVYYRMGDQKNGDQFFYLFESKAPYNVYGNFDTHRKLSLEYVKRGEYVNAITAIESLSAWWLENKGHCPKEISIFEKLTVSKVKEIEDKKVESQGYFSEALEIVDSLLQDKVEDTSVLLFVAKLFEEFDEKQKALEIYKKVMSVESSDGKNIQKIGQQLIVQGDIAQALSLFSEAYESRPDDEATRFCLLVCKLKTAEIDVEKYFRDRDHALKMYKADVGDFDLLQEVNRLLQGFNDDWAVHGIAAEIFSKMGTLTKASEHYETMYRCDPLGADSNIKYSQYLLSQKSHSKAYDLVKSVEKRKSLSDEQKMACLWIKASYFQCEERFEKSRKVLGQYLQIEPWNIPVLIAQIRNLSMISENEESKKIFVDCDPTEDGISALDWNKFMVHTDHLKNLGSYDLSYHRAKLAFLYLNGDSKPLEHLINNAKEFHTELAIQDLLKLVNTNFDKPELYFAIASLYQQMWQVETAYNWYFLLSKQSSLSDSMKAKTFLEMADCLVMNERDIDRAVEYANLAFELSQGKLEGCFYVLCHCYLKRGETHKAMRMLDGLTSKEDFEFRYLDGLIKLRNGAVKSSKEIWKPLISTGATTAREHYLKKEMLKYYYEGNDDLVKRLPN